MLDLGARLAQACPEQCIVYLQGELGAGKTVLARGFLRDLGCQDSIKSPTYALIEPYYLPHGRCVYHFDLYRLSDPEELEFLGIRDYFTERAVTLIEWPERGVGVLPPADLLLQIQYRGEGRQVSIEAGTDVGREVLERW